MKNSFNSIVNKYNPTKDDWVKIAAGVVIAGTTIYFAQKFFWPVVAEVQTQESTTAIRVELMDHEKITMVMMPSVTTVTKFSCSSVSPEPYLRNKLADLLRKNAWLAGRLKSDVDGMYLSYEPINAKASVDEVGAIVEKHFVVIDDFELPEGIAYDELERRVDHLQVKTGNECNNKADEVLFKVFLIHVKGRNEVLLVFSLSHVLADGYTFYTLQNMLDKNTPVTSMEVVRSTRYENEVRKLRSGEESMGPLAILGMIGCSALRSAMKMHVVKVDSSWVEAQKAAFHTRKSSLLGDKSVEFVSTNDILTAWHNKLCASDLQLMSINCRRRVASFRADWAGNYESHVIYNAPEDGCTPEAVRRSLSTYRNASHTTPDGMKLLNWNGSIATNWCSFYHEIDISDDYTDSKCVHMSHLPVIKSKDLSCFREGVCIFKLDAVTTGLLVFTRILTPAVLESSGVGKVVREL